VSSTSSKIQEGSTDGNIRGAHVSDGRLAPTVRRSCNQLSLIWVRAGTCWIASIATKSKNVGTS
jgi:hypothetical protein